MLYKVTIQPAYLKAELFNRETMEETREFLQIVAGAAMRHQRSSVLICVHSSNPVFTVERSGFLAYFRRLATDPSHKIALLGDSAVSGAVSPGQAALVLSGIRRGNPRRLWPPSLGREGLQRSQTPPFGSPSVTFSLLD